MKRFLSVVLFLCAGLTVFAADFTSEQLDKMVDAVGKKTSNLKYEFVDLGEEAATFDVDNDGKPDIDYKYGSGSVTKLGGGFLGIGARKVSETLMANSKGVVFWYTWEMDGSSKQESEEYDNIYAICEKKFNGFSGFRASAFNGTLCWESRNKVVFLEEKPARVEVLSMDFAKALGYEADGNFLEKTRKKIFGF